MGEAGKVNLSVIILLLVILALIGGGVFLLDRYGVLSLEKIAYPALAKLPVVGGSFKRPTAMAETSLDVLRRKEFANIKQSLESPRKELEEREAKLKEKEEKLLEREKELIEREQELAQSKRALEERTVRFEDQEKNLKRLAALYQNMKPAQAAQILQGLEDPVIIDIFNFMDDSLVAVIMMNMEPTRASQLSRKMSK
ncbi:MAG: hypothetical protein AB1797_10370 [bacterium]